LCYYRGLCGVLGDLGHCRICNLRVINTSHCRIGESGESGDMIPIPPCWVPQVSILRPGSPRTQSSFYSVSIQSFRNVGSPDDERPDSLSAMRLLSFHPIQLSSSSSVSRWCGWVPQVSLLRPGSPRTQSSFYSVSIQRGIGGHDTYSPCSAIVGAWQDSPGS